MEIDNESRLSQLFKSCLERYYNEIYDNNREIVISEVASLLNDIRALQVYIEKLSIFSMNEELDDIATGDLKYLLLPYLLAECQRIIFTYTMLSDNTNRQIELIKAQDLYNAFIESLNYIKGIIPKECYEFIGLSPCEDHWDEYGKFKMTKNTRYMKIQRFKRINELKKPVCNFLKYGLDNSDEEILRSNSIKTLILFFLESVEHVSMLKYETEILRYRTTNSNENNTKDQKISDTYGEFPKLSSYNVAPNIQYVTTDCTDNCSKHVKFFNLRELYRSKVFGPRHTLPTISIYDAADIEIKQAIELEKASFEAKKNKENDQKNILSHEYSIEEENEQMNQRQWDDWKDENPKGIGNTRKNIG